LLELGDVAAFIWGLVFIVRDGEAKALLCLPGECGVHVFVEGGCDLSTLCQEEGVVVVLLGIDDQAG
jgi:hypothetical protein